MTTNIDLILDQYLDTSSTVSSHQISSEICNRVHTSCHARRIDSVERKSTQVGCEFNDT